MGSLVTLDTIRQAQRQLHGHVVRTPLVAAPALSDMTGVDVRLKLENLQLTGAFKARGALIKLVSLPPEARSVGVIAVSAGNHAQGVAWHAGKLGIPATIVMPVSTPMTKTQKTQTLGAKVIKFGESYSESEEFALGLAAEKGLTLVHPFDDPLVISGQGTIGLEIIEDCPEVGAVIVPIGGGGLISGIATAIAATKPQVMVDGVQAYTYAAMSGAISGFGGAIGGQTLAEGIAVKKPGKLTRSICEALVRDIYTVDESAIEQGVEMLFSSHKQIAEGAGAAPVAALLKHHARFAGKTVVLVVSGGNIDPAVLATILMRGLAREGRLTRLRIGISDQPGSLANVAQIIGEGGANIVEVHHQRLFLDVSVKMTELDVLIETMGFDHVALLVQSLDTAGFPARILSSSAQNEH
ncbi:MAG: threonine ammonia-lyase [Rhodospirillaceae bacterium]|nr:threonine ammonia-lyase [Rhodospirillaceae bacterium]